MTDDPKNVAHVRKVDEDGNPILDEDGNEVRVPITIGTPDVLVSLDELDRWLVEDDE